MFENFRRILLRDDWVSSRLSERDAKWWMKLQKGAGLRFGLMPFSELSGKEFQLSANATYTFGDVLLPAYMLSEDGRPVVQMIVAEMGTREMYLALSRPVQPRDIDRLFAEEDAKRIVQKDLPRRLYVREHTSGFRDWLTMLYHSQIFAMKGKREEDGQTHEFEYSLFVDESGSKAIEFEYYMDGRLQVYVTVYRPVSEIAFVRAAPNAEPPTSEPKRQADIFLHPSLAQRPAASEAAAVDTPTMEEASASPVTHVPPAPFAAPERVEQFHCDLRVANRLIDEAIRNNMSLADIVRKVLGLRMEVNEQVSFALPLTKEDYRTLALRYHVEPTDHTAILHAIHEELRSFAGERRRS